MYFNNNLLPKKSIKKVKLNDYLEVEEFSFNNNEIKVFDNINYTIVLKGFSDNSISELAILFFNTQGERVSILDLRHTDLFTISKTEGRVTIEGVIEAISLIEGQYNIGIYVSSKLCTGNFLDLITISINANDLETAPYPKNVRGGVCLQNNFKIR